MAYEPEPEPWRDKGWLYERYWRDLLTTTEIGEMVDRSPSTIFRALRDCGIPVRRKGSAVGRSAHNREDQLDQYLSAWRPDEEPIRIDWGRLND